MCLDISIFERIYYYYYFHFYFSFVRGACEHKMYDYQQRGTIDRKSSFPFINNTFYDL